MRPWRPSPRAGLAAVAVEPLAARLGATKGSFYWHFRNRDAMLEAALQRWERPRPKTSSPGVETEPDPRRDCASCSRRPSTRLAGKAHRHR